MFNMNALHHRYKIFLANAEVGSEGVVSKFILPTRMKERQEAMLALKNLLKNSLKPN